MGLWWGTQTGSAAFEISSDENATTPQYYNLSAAYSTSSNPSLSGGWTTGSIDQQYSIYFVGDPAGPGSGGPEETDFSYDANDQQTVVTDADGQQTLSCYDGDGNLAESVPPVGVAESLTPESCPAPTTGPPAYDYGDRLASDATTYAYDALGDKTTITSPAPAGQSGEETTTNSYDPGRAAAEHDRATGKQRGRRPRPAHQLRLRRRRRAPDRHQGGLRRHRGLNYELLL